MRGPARRRLCWEGASPSPAANPRQRPLTSLLPVKPAPRAARRARIRGGPSVGRTTVSRALRALFSRSSPSQSLAAVCGRAGAARKVRCGPAAHTLEKRLPCGCLWLNPAPSFSPLSRRGIHTGRRSPRMATRTDKAVGRARLHAGKDPQRGRPAGRDSAGPLPASRLSRLYLLNPPCPPPLPPPVSKRIHVYK